MTCRARCSDFSVEVDLIDPLYSRFTVKLPDFGSSMLMLTSGRNLSSVQGGFLKMSYLGGG